MHHHIQLFASTCGRNDFFLERIQTAIAELGLDCTAEKILDEEKIEAMGLQVSCLYAYCPGCKALHASISADDPTARCTPALAIDGVLRCWDYPPDDAALHDLLRQYCD